MLGVALRFLKDKLNAFLGFAIGSVLFLEMYVSLFPSIKETSAQLNQLLETYPDAFFKAFGMDKADFAFNTVESYLATEQFSFMWPILAVILASSLANAIALNDSDKGTFEFVLAQPISRTKLFLTKYFSGLFYTLLFVGISIYGAIPLFWLHNIEYNIDRFNKVALVGAGFMVAIYSLAALISVIFSDKGKSGSVTGGVIISMYALNIISGLKENLADLKYGSFFYYFSPAQALNKGILVDWAIPVFLTFSVIATIVAITIYNRRDYS